MQLKQFLKLHFRVLLVKHLIEFHLVDHVIQAVAGFMHEFQVILHTAGSSLQHLSHSLLLFILILFLKPVQKLTLNILKMAQDYVILAQKQLPEALFDTAQRQRGIRKEPQN